MKTSDSSKPNKATKRVAIGLVIVLAVLALGGSVRKAKK